MSRENRKTTDVPIMDTIGMEEPLRYRNKVQLPVGTEHGEPIIGFMPLEAMR